MAESLNPASKEEADALAEEAANNNPDQRGSYVAKATNETAAAPGSEYVENVTPATEQIAKESTPEQIAEAEFAAKLEILANLSIDVKKREEERLESRYPGRFGNINRWMDQSNFGKAVKTVINVGVGAGEIAASAALAGTPAMLASPALFGDGVGRVSSALLEAGQFWLGKDKNERVNLEAKNAEILKYSTELSTIQDEFKSVEGMTPERAKAYYDAMSELVTKIKSADEEILQLHNENVGTKNRDKNWRLAARAVTTLVVGGLHGIPLGHQTFEGAGHAVRVSRHGFDFLYAAGEDFVTKGQDLHTYLGAVGHAVGSAMPAAAKWGLTLGAIGVGIGMAREVMGKGKQIKQDSINLPDFSLTPPVEPTPNIEPPTPGLVKPEVKPNEPSPEEMKKTIEENDKRIAEIGKERDTKSTELNVEADKVITIKSAETGLKTHIIDLKVAALNAIAEGKEPTSPDLVTSGTLSENEKTQIAEIGKIKEKGVDNKRAKAEAYTKHKDLKDRKAVLDGSKESDATRLSEIQAEQEANKAKIASPTGAPDRDTVNQLEDANAKLNLEIDEIDTREEDRKTIEAEFTQSTLELGTLSAAEQEIADSLASAQAELNKSINEKIEGLKNQQGTLIQELKTFMDETDAKLKTDLEAMMASYNAEEKKLKEENASLEEKLAAALAEDENGGGEEEAESEKSALPEVPISNAENKPDSKKEEKTVESNLPAVPTEKAPEAQTETPEMQPNAKKFAEFFETKLPQINDPKLSFEARMQIQADTFNALDTGTLALPEGTDLEHMTSGDISESQMNMMRLILALPDPSYKINLAETNKIIDAGRINARNIVESSNTISNLPVEHDMLSALAGKFEGGQFQAGGAIDKFQAYLRTNEAKFKAEAKKKEDEKSLADKQEELVKAKADLDAFKAKNVTFSGGVTPEILEFQVTGEETRNAAIKTLEDEIATLSKKPEAPANAEPEAPAAAATTETAENKPEAEVPPTVQA